jgi:hypothetical protein
MIFLLSSKSMSLCLCLSLPPSLSLSLLYFRVFCTFSPSDPWAFMLNMLLNLFPISSRWTLRK